MIKSTMAYAQLVSPNLNTVGNIGWCLQFAENVFNTPKLYATATIGWNATQYRHTDKNLPNVAVPVWYTYYESGINYGHVAIWVPGRGVLSSPWRANNTQQWYPDIDAMARAYRCNYLGWSEDIATIRVAKPQEVNEMIATREEAIIMYRLLRPNAEPSEDEINITVGRRSYKQFINDATNEMNGRNASIANMQSTINQMQQADVVDRETIAQLSTQIAELSKPPVLPPPLPEVVNNPVVPNAPVRPTVSWFVRFLANFTPKK